MGTAWIFGIGLFVGSLAGVFLVCLCLAAKRGDEISKLP
jgi:hypothetical protein